MQSNSAAIYFDRYAWKTPLFKDWTPESTTAIVIVLPAYNEPELLKAIHSLAACHQPSSTVTLLVLINESVQSNELIVQTNRRVYKEVSGLKSLPPWLTLKVSHLKLPNKKAGVGLARKIGMDEAARWFYLMGKNGVIVCFDADSMCTKNYLMEIEKSFLNQKRHVSITHYEHPLNPSSGIIPYELHLRYYANALSFAGYPKSFQTLGSCIVVDFDTYVKVGGMNTRKAGEDFYFLHKVALSTPIHELKNATIFPSDRLSERVPFGTGRALLGYKKSKQLLTYSIDAFLDLKDYILSNQARILPVEEVGTPRMREFLIQQNFDEALQKINANSGSAGKRQQQLFFNWWDGLRVLKYVHYCRDLGDQMLSPTKAIVTLNEQHWKEEIPSKETELLRWIRSKDRSYNSSNKSFTPAG